MKFRPCIDIHNGVVKQIVGGTLKDEEEKAVTNFESTYEADYYATRYKKDGLKGGHVILLNSAESTYYEQTQAQALKALQAYPGGLQIGGGITDKNAQHYLDNGASHVIVTSYVFQDGKINMKNLRHLSGTLGKEKVVLDLSCRKRDEVYYIVTNRWQQFTEVVLTREVLEELSAYCDEFLVHGVDVEGKATGIDKELVRLLGTYKKSAVTYAGGIGSMEDVELFRQACEGQLDFTIGSALDLFGGTLPYDNVKSL